MVVMAFLRLGRGACPATSASFNFISRLRQKAGGIEFPRSGQGGCYPGPPSVLRGLPVSGAIVKKEIRFAHQMMP
jgi:hypothetical protein